MPTFRPGTAIAPRSYDDLDALVALFRDAVRQLQALERDMVGGSYRRSYIRARIREANRIIINLMDYRDGIPRGRVVEWARDALPRSYQYGAGEAVRDLAAQNIAAVSHNPRVHTRAVAAVMDRFLTDTTQIVVQLHANTIRTSRVILEQAGFGTEIAQGIIGGLPRREVSRNLTRALREAVTGALPPGAPVDLTTVEINGRRFATEYWAEMHARTELARTSTAGTRVLSVTNGVHHVQITSHAHEPCICTPFEGRIYALEPNDPDGFPWIGLVPEGGVPLHPNCVHREAPAVIDYLRERDEVADRGVVPRDFLGLDSTELSRLVREHREELAPYSRKRDGYMPGDFRLPRAA